MHHARRRLSLKPELIIWNQGFETKSVTINEADSFT